MGLSRLTAGIPVLDAVWIEKPSTLPFSSAATGKAYEESSEQKEKITVAFVNKDGNEKVIQIPIGMSMLEGAHENDVKPEGLALVAK